MASFLDTGYFFFVLILFFNLGLTAFGNLPTSSYITSQAGPGLQTWGQIDLTTIPVTQTNSTPFATNDSTAKNTPANQVTNALYPGVLSLADNLLFATAGAIENSGIPSPANYLFALIIKIFMGGFTFLFGLNILNAIIRGQIIQ